MKIYEKMGINPTTAGEISKILDTPCEGFPDDLANRKCLQPFRCEVCKIYRAFDDVPTEKMKRIEIYGTDLQRAVDDFADFCDMNECSSCPYLNDRVPTQAHCFVKWVMEEVEVEI